MFSGGPHERNVIRDRSAIRQRLFINIHATSERIRRQIAGDQRLPDPTTEVENALEGFRQRRQNVACVIHIAGDLQFSEVIRYFAHATSPSIIPSQKQTRCSPAPRRRTSIWST